MSSKKKVQTKKASVAKNKTSSAKKKAPVTKKNASTGKNNSALSAKQARIPERNTSIQEGNASIPIGDAPLVENTVPVTKRKPHMGTVDEYKVNLLPLGDMDKVMENIQTAMETFLDIAENNLTDAQRRRKIGAGVRNYGFIEKVADLAEANPQYAQFFDLNSLRNAIMNFDLCRNQLVQLQSFIRSTSNTMLIFSNDGYGMSLIFYNIVKDMGRRGDPTAAALYRILQPFFKRPKRSAGPLTEKETERELHALLHSKKDGKLIVENIKPKLTGGVHKVIEEKFTDTEQFKEIKDGNIRE